MRVCTLQNTGNRCILQCEAGKRDGVGERGWERGEGREGRAENRKTGFKNLEPAPAVPTDRYI